MVQSYSELYLADAKDNLAAAFDYAINVCGYTGEQFSNFFIQSGYASKFEQGNPAVIAGISGIELARKVISYAYPDSNYPEPLYTEEYSLEYWTGWALAEYQRTTGKRFIDIFARIPFVDITALYHLHHEMDIQHFIETMEQKYNTAASAK